MPLWPEKSNKRLSSLITRRFLDCFRFFLHVFDFALQLFKPSANGPTGEVTARSPLRQPGDESKREPHQPDRERRLEQALHGLFHSLPIDPIAERDYSEVERTGDQTRDIEHNHSCRAKSTMGWFLIMVPRMRIMRNGTETR